MGFQTDAIHLGNQPDPTTGAVSVPIYQTSTYIQEELGKHKGYEYARTHNLTRFSLEKNIAGLEKGKFGYAFASGMAAITTLMSLLKNGDHAIVSNNVYGGTFRLFDKIMKYYGLEFSFVDTSNISNILSEIKKNTKMIYIETPTNPMLTITDIKAVSEVAKSKNLIHVVDNTFLSPYFQRPLELGADIVLHSTTKYLGGHSDVVGGIIVTNNEEISEKIKFAQNAMGAVPGPFDCWLVLRSTKTLALRMKQHNENAIQIAKFLAKHSKIEKVYYPGLETHSQYQLAKRQQTDPHGKPGFGGMISIEMGDIEKAKMILKNVKIFSLGESLGGVESLISHPATMTHASVPKETREKIGITDGLIRLSVGIEDIEDLISDLDNALKTI
jgi:cystathionine beta-lyase/cystathionine gamma-synthase